MSNDSIRVATVLVGVEVLDRAFALATARAELVAAGEAAPGDDAVDLLAEDDDLALLATLANPWRVVEGAEATGVQLHVEDGRRTLAVDFAIFDEELVAPSVKARLASLRRPATPDGVHEALRLLLVASLDRAGVEAPWASVSEGGEDAEGLDLVDLVLDAAAFDHCERLAA